MSTAPASLQRAAAALDRRGFLRLVSVAAAAGVLPAGCGRLPAALAPPAGAPLRVLAPRTWAAFTAATMRLVGPPGAALVASGSVAPAASADALLAGSPALAGPLVQGLWLLELGVRPLIAKWRPFTALDGPAQDGVLSDLAGSRLALKRALFAGLKSLAMATVYGTPAGRALTGYEGPFGLGRVTIADAMVGPEHR